MQLSIDTLPGTYKINAYETKRIQVNDQWINHSVIISPSRFIDHWRPTSLSDLQSSDFEVVLSLEPEVLLLGTGTQLNFPSASILAPIYQKSIGIEIMNVQAACRTYNLLLSEGRHVVAALLLN